MCPDYKGVHISRGKFSSVERDELMLWHLLRNPQGREFHYSSHEDSMELFPCYKTVNQTMPLPCYVCGPLCKALLNPSCFPSVHYSAKHSQVGVWVCTMLDWFQTKLNPNMASWEVVWMVFICVWQPFNQPSKTILSHTGMVRHDCFMPFKQANYSYSIIILWMLILQASQYLEASAQIVIYRVCPSLLQSANGQGARPELLLII